LEIKMGRTCLLLLVALTLLLAACAPIPVVTPSASVKPQPSLPPASPRSQAPATSATAVPKTVEYNLGETTVVQSRFPKDSRFHNMPVRLNGVIAAPEGAGPFPVVVILHGTHPGCPEDDMGVDRWPCDPALERKNYRGFAYLAEHLAANGYVALSMNINAENTFGFGEGTPGERLGQIVDKHLRALATASAGGENQFGIDLNGKADMHRLAFAGHSRGAEMAYALTHSEEMAAAAAANGGYGPVAGVLMIAPAAVFVDPAPGSAVPLASILPICDADVIDLAGQAFYEAARLAPSQRAWATSVFVEQANHNFFNSMLGADPFGLRGRPDCAELLTPQVQQEFLKTYALTFFDAIFDSGPALQHGLAALGMDGASPAPSSIAGVPARVAVLQAAADRTTLFTPVTAAELKINRLGGTVTADDVRTFFCDTGYYTPFMKPGSEPCRRANVVIPGNPALAVIGWEKPGAMLRFEIPAGKGDLSETTAISLRAAVDPLSELNPRGKGQAFSVRVTDAAGKTATIQTRPDEPALRYPEGEAEPDEVFGEIFTGRLPLTTIRVPVSGLAGVDLKNIREVALVFDQAPSGSLFLADVELVSSADAAKASE
jgi:dienelactone hydrolase